MEYELSLGSFIFGIVVLVAGIVFARYYKQIADNMGRGVASYERYKLAAAVTCAFGILIMTNLHSMLISWLVGLIFGN
jgi:hypothetical protein